MSEQTTPAPNQGRPNGADHEDLFTEATNLAESAADPRVPYEEIEAAISLGPDDGITLEPMEARYDCRRPKKKSEYIRCHPDHTLWQQAAVLIDDVGMDRTVYLVSPQVRSLLQDHLTPVLLVPSINQDGEFFVWPIPISDITFGRRTSKREVSARRAADRAMSRWSNVFYKDGEYHCSPARGDLGEPEWPQDLSLRTLNQRTFQDFVIANADHEIVKVYLGISRR
jgi:hypothetical protein